MKVTRRTEHRLIVEDQPWLISLVLSGFFLITATGCAVSFAYGEMFTGFVFLGFSSFVALFFVLFVRRVQVIFDRTTGTITFRSRNLWGYRETVHPLGDVSHAIKEGYDTARCVIVFDKGMSAGHHPVTEYSASGPGPSRLTDAINAWLRHGVD